MGCHHNHTQVPTGYKEVLVVEDDNAIAEVITAILEDEGFHVQSASNAEIALGKLTGCSHTSAPSADVVLLDLHMPGEDPLEMVRSLRARGDSLPPFVIISALPAVILEKAAKSIGAAGIVRKPFSIEELMTGLEKALPPDRDVK